MPDCPRNSSSSARAARRGRPGLGAAAPESLYLRPFMFATEIGPRREPPGGGVPVVSPRRPAPTSRGGVKPVTVWLCETTCGPHPAAPARPSAAATTPPPSPPRAGRAQGCDQVVWLDAAEHRWVEEMGGMNLFFVYGSGPNARSSRRAHRHPAARHHPRLAADARRRPRHPGRGGQDLHRRVAGGQRAGAITEAFACGTAAVITPIGTVKSAGAAWTVGDGPPARSPSSCATP